MTLYGMTRSMAVGPSQVLKPRPKPKPRLTPTPKTALPQIETFIFPVVSGLTILTTGPFDVDTLLDLMQTSFLVLNFTKSDLTSSCWLCYDTAPSYYQGIAVMGNYTLVTKHK